MNNNFKCPICGTTFSHVSSEIKTNTTSVTVPEPTAPLAKLSAEAKIEAMKKAGINTDNLYSMKGVTGEESIARLEEGQLSLVPDDDPIFQSIRKAGVLHNAHLFRRWVMSQMFHMLTAKEPGSRRPLNFVDALRRKGFNYQWKMIEHEMKVQFQIEQKDSKAFQARNRWFNNETIYLMAMEYIEELKKYFLSLPTKKCKGEPYVRIKGKNVFTSDLYSKFISPLTSAGFRIRHSQTPAELYANVHHFRRSIKAVWLKYDTPLSRAFINAYKGVGAYYTMQNLIMFHGALMPDANKLMDYQESLHQLESKATEWAQGKEGWKLFGLMRSMFKANQIDIEAKMAEWRK